MKTVFLALVFMMTAVGLVAGPLTLTFEEYDVDAASIENGRAFPLEQLLGMKPIFSQSVELSAEGNGKSVTSVEGSAYTLDVSQVSAESSYRIDVRHDVIAAMAGDVPIITSYTANTKIKLNVDELREVSGFKSGDDAKGRIWVVKLTD